MIINNSNIYRMNIALFLFSIFYCNYSFSETKFYTKLLEGKIKNGCSYEVKVVATSPTDLPVRIKVQEEAFARQIWDGECVNGRLHGVGTIYDHGEKKTDSAFNMHNLIYINGKRQSAPYFAENTDFVKKFKKTQPFSLLSFYINERFKMNFFNTILDGSIYPASYYKDKEKPSFNYKGLDGKSYFLSLSDEIFCKSSTYCMTLSVGEKIENISCKTDCKDEWEVALVPALQILSESLDQKTSELDKISKEENFDLTKYKFFISPFSKEAIEKRIRPILNAQLQKKNQIEKEQKRNALLTANQELKPVASPALNLLIKRAFSDNKN